MSCCDHSMCVHSKNVEGSMGVNDNCVSCMCVCDDCKCPCMVGVANDVGIGDLVLTADPSQ